MSIQGNYLGMSLSIDDLDKENLATSRIAPGTRSICRSATIAATAVSAYDRLSLVCQPTGDLDGCRGQGRQCIPMRKCITRFSQRSKSTRRIWSCWWTSIPRRVSRPNMRRFGSSAT